MSDQPDRTQLRKQANLAWRTGLVKPALHYAEQLLAAPGDPQVQDFALLAGILFHAFRFEDSVDVLRKGLVAFPGNFELAFHLGGSLLRAGRMQEAADILRPLADDGFSHPQLHVALAQCLGELGDDPAARHHGTLALAALDRATAAERGKVALDHDCEPKGKAKIIAFTLFGSDPRYLRGALHNILAARRHYSGWTCRFYVDGSVDPAFLDTARSQGAEVVNDPAVRGDRRRLLSRRFLVNDDPDVGYFLVRDCDAVVTEREARAVAEWLDSGLPFHAMRDWYSHAALILAGMWGGVSGVFPDMAGQIEAYLAAAPASTNWDQDFLGAIVWPQVRDHILVHDRFFEGHGVKPFPGPFPQGSVHVGQNEFAASREAQVRAIAPFAGQVPALGIRPRKVEIPGSG